MSEETPNIGGRPDPPPPKPMAMMFAGFALAFQVATVIVLVGDRSDIATILGIIALVFSAGTFFLLLGRDRRTTGSPVDRPDDDRGPYGPTRR
ncbi:MAG TPA: hypothetical protein VNW71_12170 [Thermoanaerobaculia bacterium]|nr:hypothetical protein [Thermoanaerobaculia bacterium]